MSFKRLLHMTRKIKDSECSYCPKRMSIKNKQSSLRKNPKEIVKIKYVIRKLEIQ